jgi:quercetin dioxygenase-like cupin family protein
MYSTINLRDGNERTRTGAEPTVKAMGYELRVRNEPRPREMRFNYFYYDEGQAMRHHKQLEQEELLFVLTGRGLMEVDGEEFEIKAGDFVVVDPDPWRQITALEPCEIFAVGAPNTRDDAVFEDECE